MDPCNRYGSPFELYGFLPGEKTLFKGSTSGFCSILHRGTTKEEPLRVLNVLSDLPVY